ncbi:MAG: hypothetical protein Q4E33_00205 [Erysipelotrichaceae bacterium]|nr:hypothetical protein [Erysipelotrichaceae bacterium]
MKKQIKEALTILNNKGYEAFLVGGAVRNYMLHKKVTDYDITTNADPNAIKMCFSNYQQYDIGKDLGTIIVLIDKVKIDITPYRKEGVYTNHRRPNKIEYASNLKQDLKRRDFTINALCMNKDEEIVDYFNGIKDLENKSIKAIGNPDTRFNEDGLRILRALRFKAKLNFKIEDKTNKAIYRNKDLLKYISNERKKDELLQILDNKSAFKLINEYHEIFNTFMSIEQIERKQNDFSNPLYSLAYILKDNDKNNLKALKYSKAEIELISSLKHAAKIDVNDDYEFITCLSNIYQNDILRYLCELHHYDFTSRYNKLHKYMVMLNDLEIDGTTIKEFGYEGVEIKRVKNHLIDLIHHKKLVNKKSTLINYLRNAII